MTGKSVLLLAPSRGLGGGIERYVETAQSAFDEAGVTTRRLDLARPGPAGHLALLARARAALADAPAPSRLVVAHRALLPVATALARARRVSGISVICHGSDVWGARWTPRWLAESALMRRSGVRIVAASSFTAGVLFPGGQATVLPPGLSRAWYWDLAAAGQVAAGAASAGGQPPGALPGGDGLEVMTAFRLAEWREKGLPELTEAIASLGRGDVTLTVCGSGEPPSGLRSHLRGYPWCTLCPGLSDAALAARYARAGLFVLATRTRCGRQPCGEGFGLVLLEAQVAGTAVVGPAHGGSLDAYLDGVTGLTPRDESAAALAQVIGALLRSPARLREMGEHAAAWAGARYAPDRFAAQVIDRLL